MIVLIADIMKSSQSGFTLIEIAIVLVIIGLLLVGVMKGQELINSPKLKSLAKDFKNVPIFINGYQDKYKDLPGDDSNVLTHLAGSAACTPAAAGLCNPGSGIIDGGWDTSAITAESYVFWQHVRLAGFTSGSTTPGAADYLPTNAIGGQIGVTNAAQTPITGLAGNYIVCSNAIPGKFAKQLDTTLDDGNTQTGSLRVIPAPATQGAAAAAPTATTSIVDDSAYLVCIGY
jgi:prepilin-type N-terminal cleavage/methylation domain-containing protein